MKAIEGIPVAAAATKVVEVTRDLTVAHYHDEMPEVYGTPMMIYLMEVAASDAIQSFLPEGWISVGTAVSVRHLAATPIGFTVTARAEVTSVEGNLVTFSVEAHDGVEKIGDGTHIRAAVQIDRFEKRMQAKSQQGAEPNS